MPLGIARKLPLRTADEVAGSERSQGGPGPAAARNGQSGRDLNKDLYESFHEPRRQKNSRCRLCVYENLRYSDAEIHPCHWESCMKLQVKWHGNQALPLGMAREVASEVAHKTVPAIESCATSEEEAARKSVPPLEVLREVAGSWSLPLGMV